MIYFVLSRSLSYFFKIYCLFLINKLIYFWLHWVFVAAQAFSSCDERGLLFIAVHRLLIAVASLAVEHGI